MDIDSESFRCFAGKWSEGLNSEQKKAALITEGPLMVLAGAGSGKTKMLTSRICHLIQDCHVIAYQILAVTFTNKAAAEMRARVGKGLGYSLEVSNWGGGAGEFFDIPEIGTFHSFCVRFLRRERLKTPFTKPFVIYDDADQLSLVKTVMKSMGLDEKQLNPKAIQGALNRAKSDALESIPTHFFGQKPGKQEFASIYEEYQKNLFKNNALDFGEIICLTYRLLRDDRALRQKYQKRYRYLHVDEYQDTNRAQYLLLSQLASVEHGGHQNICVVGDEDQSIYRWRGADLRNILDFEKDYPGAQTVKLEQNYRSTQHILMAAGQVIQNNQSRRPKTLWTKNPEGSHVVRVQVSDERFEAEFAVNEIKAQIRETTRSIEDFAIFYRTNAQSRQFEDVLRREKIAYKIVGGLRFYDRKEIKDLLSYFKVILNPFDSVSLKRIINVPARGIGKTTLEKLELEGSKKETESLWEILVRASEDSSLTSLSASKKIKAFVSLIHSVVEKQPELLLTELYSVILEKTGYIRDLKAEGTPEALARIENLEEFSVLLQEFEEDHLRSFAGESLQEGRLLFKKQELLPLLIEQTALASDLDSKTQEGPSLKLMTLHSSKGLEFPVVFMVGMEEGLFPSTKPWEKASEEEMEEERRLCYVGMTRAKEQLFLINVLVRRIWGSISFQQPSRFFDEISPDILRFVQPIPGATRFAQKEKRIRF